MNTTFYPAFQRGRTNIGWLKSAHSFSFGEYYDPDNMGFGVLRVINDDEIAGGSGFPPHPHRDMEIISIPLDGGLMHEDSMGNKTTIGTDMIQVMSAGSGVAHSEYNASPDRTSKFLQIWIEPNQKRVEPRHEEKTVTLSENDFTLLVSPDGQDGSTMIYQDAYLWRGRFAAGQSPSYILRDPQHAIYVFVISGRVEIGGQVLGPRDALGLSDLDTLGIEIREESDILLFEIPLE